MFLNIDGVDPNRLAALDDLGDQITYGELAAAPVQLTNIIPKGSVAFFLCRNTVGGLTAYVSMVENGIVPVMLGDSIDKELLNDLLAAYRPQFICAEPKQMEGRPFEKVYEERGFAFFATHYPAYPVHDQLRLLMTTSGSTGSPKLVRYTRDNLESNARNVSVAWGWTENERPICDLRMNYTMGLNVINTHLYVGATLLLVTKNITDAGYWRFIKENGATNFTGVPFSYDILWKLRFFRMDLPCLTTLSEGGGKLTDEMFLKVARFANEKGKRFVASFGTTETSARLAMLPPEMALQKVGSIGKAIPGGEMLLYDDEGNVIESMEAEGELGYRGPNVTMGYATTYEDLLKGDTFGGLYKTGDVARRDADGFYYVVGRKSRFLKILGYRVSLDQCERLIRENFNVDCACGGTDDGMDVFVTSEKNAEAIKRFLSEKTGIYSSRFTVFCVDAIPRNATGKILYEALNRRAEEKRKRSQAHL